MPLPLPNLDDRRWADLVEEGRALIPRYAPAWNDHNYHDLGITLLEAAAWVSEQTIYRLNRVTPAARRAFLGLVGFAPRPPRPARTMLALTPAAPTAVPADTVITAADAQARAVPLRTLRDLDAGTATIAEAATRAKDTDPLVVAPPGNLLPFGADPAPGAVVTFAFAALPTTQPVALGMRLQGPGQDRTERERIAAEMALQREAWPAVLPALPWPPAMLPPVPAFDPARHHSARVVWEVLTGNAPEQWTPLVNVAPEQRPQPGEVADATRALTLDGIVEFRAPPTAVTADLTGSGQRYWLRALLAAGAYEAPPLLLAVRVNAVEAEQSSADEGPAALGTGNGLPGQTFTIAGGPVVFDSVEVTTAEGGATHSWRVCESLGRSTRMDRDVALDPTAATVTCGDGERGAVFPRLASVAARGRRTLAAAGNIGAGRATQTIAGTSVQAAWDAAVGGADQESLEQAAGRAIEVLHAHERLIEVAAAAGVTTLDQLDPQLVRALPVPSRAVNVLDIERLALAVPGTRVARARAWPGVHPDYPGWQAPGLVTVIVVPDSPTARPSPSAGLRQAVCQFLAVRRTLGSRLLVVGPAYLEVSVNARLRIGRTAPAARVRQLALDALARFFDPRRGGPAGFGWPFGRDVFRSEVLQLLDGIPGVDHVEALTLTAGDREPSCGNVALCPTWLTASGRQAVETV